MPAMNIMKHIEDTITIDNQNYIETETWVSLKRRVMHEVL